MPKKEEQPKNRDITATSGLSGKSITGISVWRPGALEVVEISYSGGVQYIKFKQGLCEVGGDANWGTGTQI